MKQEVTTIRRKKRPAIWLAGGAVLIVAALIFGDPVWVHDRLAAMKLLPSPERYTELYFPQHLLLPKSAGTDPVGFSFTIHNAEGATTTYPYVVVMTLPDGKTQAVATGRTVLTDGQSRTVSETVKLPAGVTTAEIAVVLPSQQESIHFWLGAAS